MQAKNTSVLEGSLLGDLQLVHSENHNSEEQIDSAINYTNRSIILTLLNTIMHHCDS